MALDHSLPSFDAPLVSLKIIQGAEDYPITTASRKNPMNLAITFPLMTLIFRITSQFQSLHSLDLSKGG